MLVHKPSMVQSRAALHHWQDRNERMHSGAYGCSSHHRFNNVLWDTENVIRNHACFTGASPGKCGGLPQTSLLPDKEVRWVTADWVVVKSSDAWPRLWSISHNQIALLISWQYHLESSHSSICLLFTLFHCHRPSPFLLAVQTGHFCWLDN